MKIKMKLRFPGRLVAFLIVMLNIMSEAHAQENDLNGGGEWKQIREKQGIMVFTRSNPGMDFKEFRSNMTIQGNLDQFLSVLYDIEGLSSWGYNVKSASLLSREADTIQVYYTEAKAPFPYKNRDGVYLNRFRWNAKERMLIVDIDMPEGLIPEKDNLVRMKGYGSWIVRDIDDGKLEIIFQMQMDPGGNIPAWMANMFAGDTPYHTLLGLREAMEKEEYQGKSYDLIR